MILDAVAGSRSKRPASSIQTIPLRWESQFCKLRAMQKPESTSSKTAIRLPRLWLLSNRFMSIGQPLPKIVRNCAIAGVKLTILGETDLAPWVLLELAEKLAVEMHTRGGRLLVSERADLVQLAGADGLLITGGSFPVPRTRKLLGGSSLIGFLVRNEQNLERASLSDLDFLLVNNVFPSDDLNATVQASDLERLRRIAKSSAVPVFAAGGVTPQRAPLALEAGAYGVAMSEAAMESLNIGLLVEAFRRAIGTID